MTLSFITCILMGCIIALALSCHKAFEGMALGADQGKCRREFRLSGAGLGLCVLLLWFVCFYSVSAMTKSGGSWLAGQEAQERELLGRVVGKGWEPQWKGSTSDVALEAWINTMKREREEARRD